MDGTICAMICADGTICAMIMDGTICAMCWFLPPYVPDAGAGTVENRVVEVESIGYPTKFALRKWVAVCDSCTSLLFSIRGAGARGC